MKPETDAGLFTPEAVEAAHRVTERLQRELDITNADHIALWLEANMGDSTHGWLACRIIEAHEQGLALAALKSTGPASAEVEAMTERLEQGVPAIGTEIGGERVVYDVVGSSQAMRKTATMLRALSTRLAAVEAERDEALEALHAINRRASPQPSRTLGDCADELVKIADTARAFLAWKDAEHG